MKVSGSYTTALAVLTAAVEARNLDMPKATGTMVLPLDGISPMPTSPPRGLHELLRRDTTSSIETVLVAPDNTCGYISGRPGADYTCGGDGTCVFFTSAATRSGAIACCDSEACNLRVTCIDYVDYWSSSKCDNGCKVDAYTLKCSDTIAPYCNTISFPGDIQDYWCNNVDISTPQKAATTYNGESDGRTFALLTLSDSTSAAFSLTSGSVEAGASATVDTVTASVASSTSSGSSSGHKKSSTPVGPIVGGVVGGVAAIGLVALAAFFLLRKRSKQPATTTNPPPYQPPPMQQQQPGTGPNGYNPVPQQQAYYDPKNPYPSPSTQYVQPGNVPPAGGFYPVQDPNNPTSPTGTTVTDPRMSQAGVSPSPSYAGYNVPPGQQPAFQPQETVIHEAPANPAATTHELA